MKNCTALISRTLLLFLVTFSAYGQVVVCDGDDIVYDVSEYFYEGFDYCNYKALREITHDKRWYWSPRNEIDHDLNGDGKVSRWEDYERQEIETNFGKTNKSSLKIESYRPIEYSDSISKYAPALWTEIWKHNSEAIIKDLGLRMDPKTTVQNIVGLLFTNPSAGKDLIGLIEPWWDKRNKRTTNDNYNIITHNDITRPDYSGITNLRNNKDYWFNYAVYIPGEKDYPFDLASNPEIIGQWHHNSWHNNKIYNSPPPISLRMVNNKWEIWIDNGNSELTKSDIIKHPVAKVKRNAWMNFKFLINFSETTGKCHLWIDDKKVLTYDGKTVYNEIYGDKRGEIGFKKRKLVVMDYYLVMGIYKATWYAKSVADKRMFYLDDVWVSEIDQSPSLGKSLKECNTVFSEGDLTLETYQLKENDRNYYFRIDCPDTGETMSLSSPNHIVNLYEYPEVLERLLPDTRYTVKVKIPDHPVYYEYPETACEFRTPKQFSIRVFNKPEMLLTNSDKTIRTQEVAGDYRYLFRIDCPSSNETQWVLSPDNEVNLNKYRYIKNWLLPNTLYRVKVRIPDHPVYGEYGEDATEFRTTN